MRRTLLCSGIHLLGLMVVSGCSTPYVEYVTMDIERLDFRGIRMAFDVSVVNPMSIDLNVPTGGYEVEIAGRNFVRVDSVPATALPSGGSGQFSLPVELSYVQLFRLANNLKGKVEAPYELKGHVNVLLAKQEISIPFSHEGDIPIMSLPKIEVRDVGFSGGQLQLELGVSNPNTFPIGLEDLGYTIRLGNTDLGLVQAATAQDIGAESDGAVRLSAGLSGSSAVRQLMQGASVGSVNVTPTGRLRTPYGTVPLP